MSTTRTILILANLLLSASGDIDVGLAKRSTDFCTCVNGKMDCRNMNLDQIPVKPDGCEVTSLDLSFNIIEKVDVEEFQNYDQLLQLDISHNPISYVQDDSFSPLKKLTTLIMSHCELITLPDNVFSSNHFLEKLSLAHNSLERVPKLPQSLTFIDLKSNKISDISIPDSTKLEYLDINHNDLRQISSETLDNLSNISQINMILNPWNCKYFQRLMCWMYRKPQVYKGTRNSGIVKCFFNSGKKTYNEEQQRRICGQSRYGTAPKSDVHDPANQWSEVDVNGMPKHNVKTTTVHDFVNEDQPTSSYDEVTNHSTEAPSTKDKIDQTTQTTTPEEDKSNKSESLKFGNVLFLTSIISLYHTVYYHHYHNHS